jgi:hypothetical protein
VVGFNNELEARRWGGAKEACRDEEVPAWVAARRCGGEEEAERTEEVRQEVCSGYCLVCLDEDERRRIDDSFFKYKYSIYYSYSLVGVLALHHGREPAKWKGAASRKDRRLWTPESEHFRYYMMGAIPRVLHTILLPNR